jgi:putative transcriptional regulator
MLNPHEHIEDYLLGLLNPTESASFRAALASDESLRRAVMELEEAVDVLAQQAAPEGPWKKLREALAGTRRFAHLVAPLAQLYDLPESEIEALLEQVDANEGWISGLAPGVLLLPVAAGPKCEGRATALLKLQPGATFPEHTHGDEETVLVLEGGYRDISGVELWRGDVDVRAKGTTHSFEALPGIVCLCASVTSLPE